ncbi:hypothetical protein ACFOPQ_09740 [Deinococcus antarcticus]|uniref:HAMP domain-containing protein n=1 Tax=Deinococcus antarcticus TaxID=1298767 RepID=A0ABV8A8Z6_9DEIO
MPLGTSTGRWATLIENVNELVDDLPWPTTEMTRVVTAVAHGDLSQTMAAEVDGRPMQGQFLQIVTTMNTMVEQLKSFASEVTRVAREVGTEGKLGGQANVAGVDGIWKDLTENVNWKRSRPSTSCRSSPAPSSSPPTRWSSPTRTG